MAKTGSRSRASTVKVGGARTRRVTKAQAKVKIKKEAQARAPVPGSLNLTMQVLRIFKAYWQTLLGIVLVYLILNVVFASGLSNLSSAVGTIKANLDNPSGNSHALAHAISGFGSLVGSAGASGSSSGSILQSILFVLVSLVIIWSLRQLLAGKPVGVKEAYYNSMYPLIPFLLVIFVIILQLLPITLGAAVLSAVLTSVFSGLGAAAWIAWILFLALAGWSFYMLSSSIFAAYIVTLPDMQPRVALRSARDLVRYRRRAILPRLIFLPVIILLTMAILIIPLIIFAASVVAPVFYVLGMLSILFIHAYLYCLYRGLLA